MNFSPNDRSGFSLIEMLVVLAIVAILAIASVAMLRPRTTDSVHSVINELEGMILNTQHSAALSSQDIYLSAKGNWVAGTLVIDPRPMGPTAAVPPSASDKDPGSITSPRLGASNECFRSRFLSGDRDHLNAGIDTSGAWVTTALAGATNLKDLAMFNTTAMAGFKTAMSTPLCPSDTSVNTVVLSNVNKNFVTGFSIVVVGLHGGQPVAKGPIGVLVVPAGGGNVFKYFKPNGSNTWGRL